MNTYATRTEAIQREIVEPLEAHGAAQNAWIEFDIDAIADALIETRRPRIRLEFAASPAVDFWALASEHAL